VKVFHRFVALVLSGMIPACAPTSHGQSLVNRYGLGTLLHPIQQPDTVFSGGPDPGQLSSSAGAHVYIFGVNGMDPLCVGNFNGFLDYFRKNGYAQTYFTQFYTCHWIPDEVRTIRKKDPDARIVLIGYSLGANYVRHFANNLNKDDTRIDLLVYISGDFVGNCSASKPGNACRIVNVRSSRLIFLGGDLLLKGEEIDGATNRTVKCRHILTPSRRETLVLLMEELRALADPTATHGAPVRSPPAAPLTIPMPAGPVR
jgi:hypothetical protein